MSWLLNLVLPISTEKCIKGHNVLLFKFYNS